MNPLRLVVGALVAGILTLTVGSLAHAATDPYPVQTPTPTASIGPDDAFDDDSDSDADGGGGSEIGPDDSADESRDAADDNGLLPDTGGVGFYLLVLGAGLVLIGVGAIALSRRRDAASR